MSFRIPIVDQQTDEPIGSMDLTVADAERLAGQLCLGRVYLRGTVVKDLTLSRLMPKELFFQCEPVMPQIQNLAPGEKLVDLGIVEGDRVRLRDLRGPHMLVTKVDPIWATVTWFDAQDRIRSANLPKSLLIRSPSDRHILPASAMVSRTQGPKA